MRYSRMVERREQEAEARLIEDVARFERRQVEPRSKRLEHIGRTAFRRERAVAVLDDGEAAGGGDEGCRSRNVDRTGEIAAGPATVREEIVGRGKGARCVPERGRGANQLVRSLTAQAQRDKGSSHQR